MQSIGERLEEARKRKGISIREAAESTKIRSDYLHKFESNQYDLRLPEIYARGFLRSYAAFLKLPPDKIIADYNALHNAPEPRPGSRSVSREVYGRMDISTTKEPKEHDTETAARPGGTAPSMTAPDDTQSATPPATAPRSPVTFVPPHSTGSPIDKKLFIKAIVLGAIILVILILILFLAFGHGGAQTPRNTPPAYSANTTPRPLQPGEHTFDIVAKNNPVAIKVSLDSAIYYQGTLQPGEKRTFPRRVGMSIETTDGSPYTNLTFFFEGTPYSDSRGPLKIQTAQ